MNWILAIDPGNKESAYALLDTELRPMKFGKIQNKEMFEVFPQIETTAAIENTDFDIVIEMVESYGMPVGREVFFTCVWIGKYIEYFDFFNRESNLIYRHEEKMAICHSPKANDATIRTALVDRFAPNTPNKGKGYKKNPGWFYGFHADIWQAYAIGVTFHDMKQNKEVLKE